MGKGDDYEYDQSAQEKSYARGRFDPQRRALKHKANEAIQAGTKDPQLHAGIAAEIASWVRHASPNSYCSNLDGFSYNHPQVRKQWHPLRPVPPCGTYMTHLQISSASSGAVACR